jgi:16S rRNA U1498 N3-methylase RsmE
MTLGGRIFPAAQTLARRTLRSQNAAEKERLRNALRYHRAEITAASKIVKEAAAQGYSITTVPYEFPPTLRNWLKTLGYTTTCRFNQEKRLETQISWYDVYESALAAKKTGGN